MTVQEAVERLATGPADEWDAAGRLPVDVLRDLGRAGVLCAQVPTAYGGPGLSSMDNGELTATVGTHCGSVRSVMTAHGMAAWTVARHGDDRVRAAVLPRLTGGDLIGVAFSEAQAGSDLSAVATTVRPDGDGVVVTGRKVWVTGAGYADLVLVFGRYGDDGAGAAVLVPTTADGVTVTPAPSTLGCRAAGHADVALDGVRVPADHVVAAGLPMAWLVTSALTYGRLSVAWGCVGILRACREAAVRHARDRRQFGVPVADHQLVARHLAELWTGEQVAARACEHASRAWDDGSTDVFAATVLAKYVAAGAAARGAGGAMQVLASAGVPDGTVVARAYRDAKLMELIEGSTEICQTLLADHARAVTP